MKKLVTTASLALLGLTGRAQAPNINMSHFFQLDRAYPYCFRVLDSAQRQMGPGSAGANVTWDFSAIRFSTSLSIDTTRRVVPASTPKFATSGVSGTDTADICLLNLSASFSRTEAYRYLKQKGTKIVEFGADQDNGVVEDVDFKYTSLPLYGMMPAAYGTRVADSFRGTYWSYLTGPHWLWGSDSIMADGYGILKVGGLTFRDCIRLKQVHNALDSFAMPMSGPIIRHQTKWENYTWYSANREGPVLIMERWLDENDGRMKTYAVSYYFPPNSLAVEKPEARAAKVYPNPAGNIFCVQVPEPVPGGARMILYDVSGRAVLEQPLGAVRSWVDISHLPCGIYRYQIHTPGAAFSGSVVKE